MLSENFTWKGYEWMTHPKWGYHHPNDKKSWYDHEAVRITTNDLMVLDIHENPKEFIDTIPYGIGFVRTIDEFKYGIFEWECKVPYGRRIWPALWLASDYSWPPEIDVMEGWSEDCPNYVSKLFFRKIHPTAHWSENCDDTKEHRTTFTKPIFRWILKCGNHYDKYKLIWTKDYVDIFYNEKKIKRFDDKEFLAHLNKDNIKMHVIMDNKPDWNFNDEAYKEYVKNNSPMVIKSFKYTPLNK